MSLFSILDIAGSALSAQSVRLNATASNLANADTMGNSPETVYKARRPVFASILGDTMSETPSAGVRVTRIEESNEIPLKRYQPHHPIADAEGFVWAPNVEVVEEMADMISASRAYQANVEIANTTKDLALQTLNLGR